MIAASHPGPRQGEKNTKRNRRNFIKKKNLPSSQKSRQSRHFSCPLLLPYLSPVQDPRPPRLILLLLARYLHLGEKQWESMLHDEPFRAGEYFFREAIQPGEVEGARRGAAAAKDGTVDARRGADVCADVYVEGEGTGWHC